MEKKTFKACIRGATGDSNRPELFPRLSLAQQGNTGNALLELLFQVGACSGPQRDHSKGQEGHNSGWELLWSWGVTRAKPELPWLLNLLKDWYVNTQRSQVGWGSVRPLTSEPNKLYGRNVFLQTTAAALRVQM